MMNNNGIGVPFACFPSSPYRPNPYGLKHYTDPRDSSAVYRTGTEATGLKALESEANIADGGDFYVDGLGGLIQQSTAADQLFHGNSLSPTRDGGTRRVLYGSGGTRKAGSSLAATNYAFAHQESTIIFPFMAPALDAATQILLGTAGTGGSTSRVGFAFSTFSSTSFRWRVMNGLGVDYSVTAGIDTLAANTLYRVVARVQASGFDLRINGSSVASGSLTAATSSSDPFETLYILGRNSTTGNARAFLGPVLIYNRYLRDDELVSPEHMMQQMRFDLSSVADVENWIAAHVTSGTPEWFDASSGVVDNGSNEVQSWAGRLGNHSANAVVGTPILNDSDAGLNSEASITLLASTVEGFNVDSMITDYTGSDQPMTLIAAFKKANTTGIQTLVGMSDGVTAGTDPMVRFDQNGSTSYGYLRDGDTGSLVSITGGTPDTNAHVQGICFRGTEGSLLLDSTLLSGESACDADSMTLTKVALGFLPRSTNAFPFDGNVGSIFLLPVGTNDAEYLMFQGYLKSRYATT